MADSLPVIPGWTKPIDYPSVTDWLKGEFSWANPTFWAGVDGYVELGAERLARISLDADRLDRFLVTIIHKSHGAIDRKEFWFSEHLEPLAQPGVAIAEVSLRGYGARGGQAFCWQIAVPADTGTLVRAVETYLELFR